MTPVTKEIIKLNYITTKRGIRLTLTEYQKGYLTGVLLIIICLFFSQLIFSLMLISFRFAWVFLTCGMLINLAVSFRIYLYIKDKVDEGLN